MMTTDEMRVPRTIEGTWPADDLRRAFAAGAAWWNYESTGFTMFSSERTEAENEAELRYPGGKIPVQEPETHLCAWIPLHFGGIIVGCTSMPWSGDVPEVCPYCHNPVTFGELSY